MRRGKSRGPGNQGVRGINRKAVADIKIAVRSRKPQNPLEFIKRAMAPCASLSVERLSSAALSGMDAICEYLEGTCVCRRRRGASGITVGL